MKVCFKCGDEMSRSDYFCRNCGWKAESNKIVENSIVCEKETSTSDYVCKNCGRKLSINVSFCMNCGNNITLDKTEAKSKKVGKDKGARWGKTSLILALIPIILFTYCLLYSGGSLNEGDDGAVWWLMIMYYWSFGIPFFLISLFSGLVSYNKYNNRKGLVGVCLDLLPILLFIIYFFLSLLFSF